jgi:alpha-L-fucosidase
MLKTLFGMLLCAWTSQASPQNPNTDWFRESRYGLFMHFLPANPAGLARVSEFDVPALAQQLTTAGARYFVITLGQNSGYYIAPNATYDRYTGYAAGERCATRDLPAHLFAALRPRGIRLLLYLPCQVPNQDARAQRAFGLREGPQDQPLSVAFARKWAEVIREWSDRYGEHVSGWWFDGGYKHIQFAEAIAQIYAEAAKHGNPKSIVTFNPGVRVIRYTAAEDYTAGELNEPFATIPASRWLDGSQWHALTFLGSHWSGRETRFPTDKWVQWVKAVAAHDGVVTLDVGPNWEPTKGPIGSLATEQLAQVQAINSALRPAVAAPAPPRRKRAQSFFGLHFDFHAGPDCTEVGKNTTPAMVERIIEAAQPDYLQIDCKGHPGFSSYPTKAGQPVPGFVGDPLRVWRDTTARHGVALYTHYSGVWDSEAIRRHPDWGALNADGKTNPNATSFFSPYADQLLIPQLRELAGDYGVDGAWVDGECWAAAADYGAAALGAFATATGIPDAPRKASDPHWFEFLQFNREAFRRHLRHYVSEVKKTDPQFQLCSNWAFSDHMPEPVCAPVDWLSGDFSPEDSVNSARFSARYLAQQGHPWDLMAWGFTIHGERRNGSNMKSAVQLQREAAIVLALGGGFQFYYNQRRDGSVPEDHLPVIAEVAKFCRARQAFCQGAKPVPQVALLYSTASHYREMNSLFGRDLSRLSGTLQALLESQQVVDVVSEHHLAGRMAEHPLIVVGECDYLEPAFQEELRRYVQTGGKLLLLGPRTAAFFASDLGVNLEGTAQSAPRYLAAANTLVPVRDLSQRAVLAAKAQPVGRLFLTNDTNSAAQPAASIARLGKGRIAATYSSFSRDYLQSRSPAMRAFLNDLVRQLHPKPLVEISGPATVDVTVNRLRGKLAVNLVNTSGPHWDANKPLFDTIEPLGPLTLTIRTPKRPAKVTLEPGGQPLSFAYRAGEAQISLPRLDIHGIVQLD